MKPIELFGAGVQSKSKVANSQRRLNCYYEVTVDGEKSKTVIYGTPGLTLTTSFNNHARALRTIGNNLYVVNGPNVTKYDLSFTAALLAGSIPNNSGIISLTNNITQGVVVDGIGGYYFTLPSGTITAIASNFPNGATTAAYLGGYVAVEVPNSSEFQLSALNDATTWPASFIGSAYSSPDNLVAVDVDHGVLILFGVDYIEFWTITGALDFPMSPVSGSAQEWGLAAKNSRAKIDNSIIFLAQNLQGQYQVMQLNLINSYAPVPVSTNDINNLISKLSTPADAVALSYMIDGHNMYQITFQSAQRSLLYDCSTKIWSETQTGLATTGRHVGDLSVTFGPNTYISDYSNTNLYQIAPETYTDNGVQIQRLLQTRHQGDGNEFAIDELFLDMNTGSGLQSGQGSDPQMMLQVSKDGGRTFGYERWKGIGKVGQYESPRVVFNRVAHGRDIVLRLKMTDPVKFVVTRAMAVIRPGV